MASIGVEVDVEPDKKRVGKDGKGKVGKKKY